MQTDEQPESSGPKPYSFTGCPPRLGTPQSIPEVLRSVEARAFWERVYIAVIKHPERYNGDFLPETLADQALAAHRERFEPKAEG